MIIYSVLRRIIGIPIKAIFVKSTSGINNIPLNGPAIIALNHQSYFDFICFAAVAPRNIHFLAAEKFFHHWAWRILMIATGQIKVDRTSHDKSGVHEAVKKHFDKGLLIGIFPEGTRSPHEFEMLKAFDGVARFALHHRVPIIPVGLKGTFTILSKHKTVPRFLKIVEIHVGKPMYFMEHFGKHNDKHVCEIVTHSVMKQIEVLSGKKYLHELK